jgi:hypothetical protein
VATFVGEVLGDTAATLRETRELVERAAIQDTLPALPAADALPPVKIAEPTVRAPRRPWPWIALALAIAALAIVGFEVTRPAKPSIAHVAPAETTTIEELPPPPVLPPPPPTATVSTRPPRARAIAPRPSSAPTASDTAALPAELRGIPKIRD